MSLKNENRPGYRTTKAGWIPMDWECSPLGAECHIASGGTPSRKEPLCWGGNVPWVNTGLINFNVIEKTEEHITEEGIRQSAAKIFPAGSILMAMYGQGKTRGKVAMLGIDAATNQACAAILARNRVNSSFLFQYLHSRYRRIREIGNASTQKNLNSTLLKAIPVPFPSLLEQKAIAGVLECWDKAIRNYEKKIEKKRNIKKGLMQRLLSGKQRLPGFSGEWKEVRLGEVFNKILGGGTPSKKEVSYWKNGDIPWASVKDFTSSRLKHTQDHITDAGLKNSASNLIPANTLLLATRMAVGKCLLTEIDTSINQDIKALFLKENMTQIFIFYLFQSLESYFDRVGSGSTVKGISLSTLQNTCCRLPSLEEQQAIASVLSAADSEIEAMERKLASLKDQKKFLLNNLVTGTIRLPRFRGGTIDTGADGDHA